jgi:hypothetical protein
LSNSSRNFQLFASGRKGSGKDTLISLMGRRFKRRLICDSMGQHDDTPAADLTWTLGQTVDALRRAARRDRWTVVAAIGPQDTIELINCIAPPRINPKDSFTYKVGGIVIESGEVDQLAPPHQGIDPAVQGIISRGRHYRVSSLFGARRPSETNRILTSQCDMLAAFAQHEPGDVDYLRRTATADIVRYLEALKAPYEYVRLLTASRKLAIIDANGRERQP